MHKTLELFIGSNNTTHKVEIDRLKAILNEYHEGYTMQNALGSWLGVEEDSVIVTISDDMSTIMSTIKTLKTALQQDAIAYREVTPLEFI